VTWRWPRAGAETCRQLKITTSKQTQLGTALTQWLRCCGTNRKVAGSIPAGFIGIFHWRKILPFAPWPWGRLSLWQKWVPEAFPGVKDGRCVRLTTLPPSCADVTKSGNLNFLEPSGPLQACNGTDLTLTNLVVLCSCDRASSAKREERIPTRCNNIDDLLSIPDVYYWLQSRLVSGIFMPIIRRKDHVLLHMGYICW